ncbi:MAG: hypothetical protein AAF654_14040 [Myxococcota bacterium]
MAYRISILLGVLGWLTRVAPASACSCANQLNTLVPADAATIPENAPALVWMYSRWGFFEEPGALTLTDLSAAGGAVSVSFAPIDVPRATGALAFAVAPATLREGASYRVDAEPYADSFEAGPRDTWTFTVGAPAPLPDTLGTLSVLNSQEELISVPEGSSCVRQARVRFADVQLEIDSTAAPWEPLLLYTTYVDDAPYAMASSECDRPPPGQSWQGRGLDRIVAPCANGAARWGYINEIPSPGPHTVQIEATVPGTVLRLRTPPVTVDLTCDAMASPEASPDAVAESAPEPEPEGGGCAQVGILGPALFGLARRRRRVC